MSDDGAQGNPSKEELAAIQQTIALTVAESEAQSPEQTLRADAETAAKEALRTLPRLALPSWSAEEDQPPTFPSPTQQWEVRSKLGEGGMGAVYEVVQRSLGRSTAVKLLSGSSVSPLSAHALLREAQITGMLEHPNIPPVHLLGLDALGNPALVMKRIDGVTWRTLLREPEHPLWQRWKDLASDTLSVHLQILLQVCNAVQFAHERGVLHRDIKTENVMVGAHGEVYLLDWGIALEYLAPNEIRRTVGTPSYMAPEMVEGNWEGLRPPTDVYLLGATLHEVLTGHPRHHGSNLQQVLLHAYLSEPFSYDASVPAELAQLCRDACARSIKARPASVEAFRQRLVAYLDHAPSVALSTSAMRALEELKALPAGAKATSAQQQLAIEARFGFLQALRRWEGNTVARDGYRALVLLLCEQEIERKNLSAVKGLLSELSAPDEALLARVAKLESEVEESKEKEAHFKAEERELDPVVTRRERFLLIASLFFFSLLLAGYFSFKGNGAAAMPTPKEAFFADLAVGVLAASALFGVRSGLLANRFGRRYVLLTLLGWASSTMVDVIGWIIGIATPVLAPAKLLMPGWILITAGAMNRRGWMLPGVYFLVGATLGTLYPERTNTWMFLSYAGASVLLVAVHWSELVASPSRSQLP